jgi:agmatine deiminase
MNTTTRTPAALGFRMPAEWTPHEATWIAWPHNRSDWPGKFEPVPWAFGEFVREIARGETVRVLVNGPRHAARARRVFRSAGTDLSRVQFLACPTNRAWARDFGPIFVRRRGARPGVAIVRFGFNGWARYPDWRKDAAVPAFAARRLRVPLIPARRSAPPRDRRSVVLEGGSIDVNGKGTLLTTEECLLDPKVQVRNPGLSRKDLEAVLRGHLGATNVLWLGKGIAGDDTHGHVDDLCRFVGPRTVVLARETNPRDVNYRALAENRERLKGMRLEDGGRIEVVDLPMPPPVVFDGLRLPASYANFYIANAAVVVPTFNAPTDRIALGILAGLFRDRPVVGVHAADLVLGKGSIHCLTQQEPR